MANAKTPATAGEKKEPEKKPEPPFPETFTVIPYGKEGEYSFDVWVYSNQKRGIVVGGQVLEGGMPKGPFQTNQDGFFHHNAEKFDENERQFTIMVGPRIIYNATLLGKKQEKIESHDDVKVLRGQGFLANFNNVLTLNRAKRQEESNESGNN